MGRRLVGRATRNDFDAPRINEMTDWLRSLGIDPTNIALLAAVVQSGDRYELHLTEYLRDEQGQRFLDLAADQLAARPVVVPVEKDSWPAWLAGRPRHGGVVSGGQVRPVGECGPELYPL